MITTNHATVDAGTGSWSGIDAGRRVQVGSVVASVRSFRPRRRGVKHGSREIDHRIELRGNPSYLRALRAAEMNAWHASGGDFYRQHVA